MSMSCADYSDLILRLPDGDLDDEEAELLQAHLRTCMDCRRAFRAVKNLTDDLGDLEEAPGYLAENVMSRIRIQDIKDQNVSVRSTAGTGHTVRKKHARRRFGKVVAIAACFAVILGAGGYMAARLLRAIDTAGSSAAQSVVMEEPHTIANAAAEVAAPEAETAAGAYDAGPAESAEAAEENALQAARSAGYSWENPARVPDGREAEFEALIRDAGWPDGVPQTSWHLFTAVEYQGIIYEFLTDDNGEFLLWRDAAETAVAIHSPGTIADLWSIIG